MGAARAGGCWQHAARPGAAHPVLHGLGFVNRSRLAAGAMHEAHAHDDHEEVFVIVGGRGAVRFGDEVLPVREGDAIFVPIGTNHGLINDSDDWLDFLAIGGALTPATQ